MGGESREYRLWREQRNITPWVETRQRADKHKTIRAEVKGKKKRVEIAGNYPLYMFDSKDIASVFMSAVDYYSNVGLVFRNKDTKEYKKIPICSRWNTRKDDWYKKRYWDIFNSVKNEKKATMLAIGYDQRHIYQLMNESGWKGDFYGYLMSRIGDDISAFLKRLRSFYKRKEWKWSYRGYTIEPYEESGLPHIHFFFKGGWIANIDDLVSLWKWSKPQGIKVTVRTGSQAAGYLSSYLKKAIKCIRGNQVHLFYAYAYFYGINLYRVAYGKRKKENNDLNCVEIEEGDIPVEKGFEKGRWACVGTDSMTDHEEWDRRFKPFGRKERVSIEEYEKNNNIFDNDYGGSSSQELIRCELCGREYRYDEDFIHECPDGTVNP